MKRLKYGILILAAALNAGGFSQLTTRAATALSPQGIGALRGHFLERAKQRLGLTDEQTAQIKAVLQAEKDTLVSLLSQFHDARAGLRAAIQAPDADEASVRAASAKVASVEADLAVERFKLHGKISPILTDEQRAKIKEFQARRNDLVDTIIGHIGERLAE
jgi:Spy/CpxP family protein refolding chaperone